MTFDNITTDPTIMRGKPTITGTRLTVDFILEELAKGHEANYLLENYPRLKREDINVCLKFAAHYLYNDELIYA